MTEATERERFLVAFAEWQAERERISEAEAHGTAHPDDWHGSDDDAVDLLEWAAGLIKNDS